MTRGRKRKTRKLVQYYGEDFAREAEEEKARRSEDEGRPREKRPRKTP